MDQPTNYQPIEFAPLKRGISQFNHDFYAILGLPVNIQPSVIRQGYLNIARILHPDIYGFDLPDKALRSQYLARLVNPAYDMLMRENERNAYQGIYKLLARRLMQKSRNIEIHYSVACDLMIYPNDAFYERSVVEIAKMQYQNPAKILEYTAQISELNLVYILYKEGYNYGKTNVPPVLVPLVKPKSSNLAGIHNYYTKPDPKNDQTPNQKNAQKTTPNPYFDYPSVSPSFAQKSDEDQTVIQTNSNVDQSVNNANAIAARLRKCEIYLSQKNWKIALKELREILQIDPNNSRCLAMLGVLYKNIDQPQMARISLQRSLQLNPQEPLALKYIQDFPNPVQPIANKNDKTNSDPKLNSDTPTKNQPISPPQKRGWISNLLGWSSPDDKK
jgi:curved DNA-binding protein CbpA